MTRETLDRQMNEIFSEIIALSGMVERAVLDAVEALKQRDINAARQIYANDLFINDKRFEIENNALIMIPASLSVWVIMLKASLVSRS